MGTSYFSCLAFDEFVCCKKLKENCYESTCNLSSTCVTCSTPILPKHVLRVLLSHTDNCYILTFILPKKINQYFTFIFFNTDHYLKLKKNHT